MAGKYGSASITITYDDGPGGTGRAITSFVLTMGGVKITSNTEQSNAFGDAWEKHNATGVSKVEPITLEGFWDTTATTGPHVVFLAPDDGPQDATRTLVIAFGDSKTFTCETILKSYEVLGQNGNLTRFKAEILPTGTPVGWA
jgi:hypothetical protein